MSGKLEMSGELKARQLDNTDDWELYVVTVKNTTPEPLHKIAITARLDPDGGQVQYRSKTRKGRNYEVIDRPVVVLKPEYGYIKELKGGGSAQLEFLLASKSQEEKDFDIVLESTYYAPQRETQREQDWAEFEVVED